MKSNSAASVSDRAAGEVSLPIRFRQRRLSNSGLRGRFQRKCEANHLFLGGRADRFRLFVMGRSEELGSEVDMGNVPSRLLPVAITLVALLVSPVFSQANYGSLSGTVRDQSGAAVPGADVTITNQGTNASQALITSDVGTFRVTQLLPAFYEVRVALIGFQTYVGRDVKVNVGGEHSLNVTLDVGELTSIVTVAAGVDLVNTSDTSISTTVQTRQIQDLPLQARNVLNLITLQAGTAFSGNAPTSIQGLRPTYTNMTLDGINIQDNFIRENATTFSPSRLTQSMVSEFTLSSINQGSVSGAGASQISFVTPSGMNDVHGEVYWVHRNNATKANEFFNNLSGVDKPFLLRNQFGVAASGPIIKDRLFWYGNYEGFRQSSQQSILATVLSDKARQGIYQYEALNGSGLQEIELLPMRSDTEADPFMANQNRTDASAQRCNHRRRPQHTGLSIQSLRQ